MQILSVDTQSTMTIGQPTKGGNSPARLSANVDSLCTSETRVTVSQKLSWLTHSDPQRGERARQQGIQRGGGYAVQVVYDDEGQLDLIC